MLLVIVQQVKLVGVDFSQILLVLKQFNFGVFYCDNINVFKSGVVLCVFMVEEVCVMMVVVVLEEVCCQNSDWCVGVVGIFINVVDLVICVMVFSLFMVLVFKCDDYL